MRLTISIPAVVAGALLGSVVRFSLTYSEVYNPGWLWWFQRGLHASPGTAGFAGYVASDVFMSNNNNVSYCQLVSVLPGLFGGALGAAAAAIGRPVIGAVLSGVISGVVLLLMRLPELYRPGWFGSLWWDYNFSMIVEAVAVGAVIGALAGFVGRLMHRRDQPGTTSACRLDAR